MLEIDKKNQLILKLTDSHFLYKLDDSLIWLFNIESGEHYNLNESSYFALSLFDNKRTLAEILQLYVDHYLKSGIDEAALIEDFNNLIVQFENAHVITLKNG